MNHSIVEESIDLNGQTLSLQTGKLALAATTSIIARLGDTCVLVTVTAGKNRPDIDYVPLSVEYVEKLYAGGRIKGSRWVKREGRPTDDAILKGRIIDRSIRPLFPKTYRRDLQVIATLLSIDGVNSAEIVAAIAVSAALHISSVPWDGPISTMRVGYIVNEGEGSYVYNPTETEQKFSTLDLIVSSTKEKVLMIETKAEIVKDDIVLDGIQKAKEMNAKIIDFIEEFRKKTGNVPKEVITKPLFDEKLINTLKHDFHDKLEEVVKQKASKETRNDAAVEGLISAVAEKFEDTFDKGIIAKAIQYLVEKMIHDQVLESKVRIDGRNPDQVRPLAAEVSFLNRTHGSAIFSRGDTQVLSIVTLGAPSMEQLIESPEGEEAKRYIHHYYMPPYTVGETGRIGTPSRREIGHGALAEKAIEPVLPSEKDFPYTIRVVSEVLSSNGSTSMASTCGSSLALMDAGVPIKAPVAGIAIGILTKSDTDYVLLTDIQGIEDFSGEMDFKIAGTTEGITAIQLDVKNKGLTHQMVTECFAKAKVARLKVLEVMNGAISTPRKEISKFAPKVVVLTPPQEKIGEIIGPGGRNIRNLIAMTQTQIDVSDDGKVTITGIDKAGVEKAKAHIENVTREVHVGETFEGEIKRLLPFGAFVEFLPGKEGMIHISKMGAGYVKNIEDVAKVGQRVKVEVFQIDDQGRVNLRRIDTEEAQG